MKIRSPKKQRDSLKKTNNIAALSKAQMHSSNGELCTVCHSACAEYAPYLVNVLQLVNDLTDHWLRALHLQLMEVELIFHSIPRCLLAVSVKVKVNRFVKERPDQWERKLTVFSRASQADDKFAAAFKPWDDPVV